ncbi:MAG TPA: hypothetical protein VMG12_18230, partial [Polyangiaceae bacterium]|nr:hypothetical protein [Polyangiaceae bacterium]
MLSRRSFLNLCIALGLARRAFADEAAATEAAPDGEQSLTWKEVSLDSDDRWGRRALVLHPTGGPPGQTYPGLLLFHGRGETSSEQAALHAWREDYGLERSDARLRRPPIAFSNAERRYIEPEQLAAIHERLQKKPFTGLCVICPVTPNARRAKKPEAVLDRYSEWIEHTLLPAVRDAAPLDTERGLGVDGCSMGGYVAAEVFVRKPHLFRSFGVVQPAVGEYRVARYARHLANAMQRHSLLGIHLQTSTRDPYRGAV